jgi:hypothetical protein
MDLKQVVVIALSVIIVSCSAISGCTYVISEDNRLYAKTMEKCIESGGNFVPNNNGTVSTCIKMNK